MHKYEMGIIGNCSYMSYIDKRANVVWQCWPFFDSSFIFGSLVDQNKGGEFSITPCDSYESHQYYEENTNILVTHFKTQKGSFEVVDFAPRFELYERFHKPLMLFRKIRLISGSPSVKVTCTPVGEYGEIIADKHMGSNHIAFSGLDEKVRLTTNIARSYIFEEKAFALTEDKYLVLSWGSPLEAPLKRTFEDFYDRTKTYWRKWIERSSIPNIYQEQVIRSALLLKLHQFEDTGAIIASGTTSLPEHPGEERNWDYRYCWIRDAYFTLSALTSLGHFNEAERYSHFIQDIVQHENSKYFQPVYSINANKELFEKTLPLAGYQGNKPVRVGNLAYKQIQHDVYGQMLLALMPLYTDLRVYDSKSAPHIEMVHKLLDKMIEFMQEPDAGIWEFRGKKQKHAESYLFHWAGAHAALKISKKKSDQALKEKAQKVIDLAQANIEKCFDKTTKAYGMSQENKKLNASEFLLITMNYLDPSSSKAINHFKALEEELKVKDELIYRYRDIDDFGETHSTFLICGFWYAEALIDLGEISKAKEVFEKLMKRSNELGIFSEDIDPKDGSQWGNIAQTYSHVGLINTAFKLAKKMNLPDFLA